MDEEKHLGGDTLFKSYCKLLRSEMANMKFFRKLFDEY